MSRKKKGASRINHKSILKLFNQSAKPLAVKEIFSQLSPSKAEKKQIHKILADLVNEGKLISIGKGRAYGLTNRMDLVQGTLQVQRSGVGFVLPKDKRRKDIFVSPDNLGEAWDGDQVMVALLPKRGGKNPEGRIVRILERSLKQVPVLLAKKLERHLFLGQPTGSKLRLDFLVDISKAPQKPGQGQVAVVSPEERLDTGLWKARCLEILGWETEPSVQEEVVKLLHQIPRGFSSRVLEEVGELPDHPSGESFQRRTDLRSLPFVTIDGAKAKDFDDAICVERTKQGSTLYVAIADVSAYVDPGSQLDKEAKNRGNSYYFPGSVEPMFPEKLSNGLCSLKPSVPRLVLVAQLECTSKGEVRSEKIYPGVISSWARLTYAQVKRALLDDDAREQKALEPVLPMLRRAEELARLVAARRRERGSLDFDLPEPEILFNMQDEGFDIRPKVSHFGHQIIEEFMIAANEAVARFLTRRGLPLLYRIHPEPDEDRLKDLFTLLRKTELGPHLPEDTDLKSLQSLLQAVEGSDLEFLVNRLLLRTMMQASYSPENAGHFGLASDCYCHFTSPIRRYADLVVHRAVKKALQVSEGPIPGTKKLYKVGDHLSQQERRGMAAEREIFKRLTVIYLMDRIGEAFNGIVASVSDFGMWIELKEVLAEGLVRLSSLTDDYYVYWPNDHKLVGQRTARMFTLGQSLSVRLTNVSLARQEIDLELDEPEQPA